MIKPKPKDSLWTDDQWRAVVLKGQNILVSAGAGSGKTAVLTERIIEHVKSGIDIRNLVVLTFTNAAAREMRERVQSALKKASIDRQELVKQLEYIDQAQITTFDAYSQFLLKKYHHVLNIDSNFQIIDNVTVRELKTTIVDQIFEKHYQNQNPQLLSLAEKTTIMDDQKLRDQVLFLMDKLDNDMTDYDHQKFINFEYTDRAVLSYLQEISNLKEELNDAVNMMRKTINEDKFATLCDEYQGYLSELISADEYYKIREFFVSTAPFKKQLPRVKHPDKDIFKEYYQEAKDIFKELEKRCTYESTEAMIEELKLAHQDSEIITEIAKEANQILLAEKLKLNAYEFVDVSKLVIKILQENPSVLAELKSTIDEILLDEYQDTNDIQECFINTIANNNVYMVGDIKQAIYGFRNANPRNFAKKYLEYSQNNGGMVIDLNKNFRSREEVLANINLIFKPLMCLTVGGIDYEGKQTLVYGNKMYETKNPNQDHNMEIITYEANEEMKRHEQEARLIARDIITKLANNYEVNEKGSLRKATFKDFAILTATKTNFGLYKKIFEEFKIPLQVQSTMSDDTENEIHVISSLFKLLSTIDDNGKVNRELNRNYFKFGFLSIARSYICEFNDYEITKQIAKSGNIYDVINNPINVQLSELAHKILDIRSYYNKYNLQATLLYAIEQLGIYQQIYRLDSVHDSEAKIRQMLELFSKFSSEHKNIIDVVTYMELLRSNTESFELEAADVENNDVVTMMTIHKSKGLEFNVVYFPQMEGKFNASDINQKEMYSRDYGYITQVVEDFEFKNTILHTVVKTEAKREMISEQIRLFYVALTRAKDKFIIISQADFASELPIEKIPVNKKMKFNKFMDFLSHAQGNLYDYNLLMMLEHQDLIAPELYLDQTKEDNIQAEAISYVKIEMDSQEISHQRASMTTYELIDAKTKANMKLGTDYHEVLECIDFASEIDNQLVGIDEKLQKIIRNIASLEQVIGAKKTYNEYQFIYNQGNVEIVGIIDLLVEKEDELIIIDYKLDNIHKDEYLSQIKTYAEFLKQKSAKKVSGYLYSLVRNEIKEVQIND